MSFDYSGERFIPGVAGTIEAEHLHRYTLVRAVAHDLDVLDVACGEGYGSALLSEVARSVVGVDIDGVTVALASEKYAVPNLRFVQGDCARLPLEDSSVDLVVSFETIEHHDRHEDMMREIRRVLRPDGVLLISSPNRPEYDKTLSEPNPFHVMELDFDEFAQLLRPYFANVTFYAQRVVSGSLIVPYGHDETGFVDFEEGAKSSLPHLARPIYFLALASDGDLSRLGASLFERKAGYEDVARSHQILEARVYFSGEEDQGYDQANSKGALYPLDGKRQELVIGIDARTPLARLRVDPANGTGAISLHALSIQHPEGAEIWRWGGHCEAFRHLSGVFCWPGREDVLLLCLDDDPQFELAVPPEVLALAKDGFQVVIEFTPRPLLDALPSVLAEMQAKAAGAGLPALSQAALPVGLSNHLADLAGLLKAKIDNKNALITAQRAEIESLHERQQALYEQLIRAEAQLDLLKEFVLPEGAGRIERL